MVLWVLPVKDLTLGKTRLEVPGVAREDLIVAMLCDTVEAVLGSETGPVVLVSPDERVEQLAAQYSVKFLFHNGDLNAAIAAAVSGVSAALLPDLPAVRAEDLRAVVLQHARGFVPDAAGTGTTCAFDRDLQPHFGPGSAAAHAAAGLPLIDAHARLRRDVDTAADLAQARQLGLGRHTAALLVAH